MNFINLLRTWAKRFNMSDNRIRKDDLDALGGMANMVGTYMKDFAQKADSDARPKLFKGGINVRDTLARALLPDENDPARVVIPDDTPLVDVPISMPPSPPPSLPQSVQSIPNPSIQSIPNPSQNIPTGRREDEPLRVTSSISPPNPQMEFSFVEQSIRGYGSVGEVIKHFDERFDKIEESIKLIKMFMVELKANLIKRKYKVKDASQTPT